MKGAQSSEPSKSQLLPFGGNALDLTTKPYFLPGLIVAILVPLLFSFVGGQSTIPITYMGVPVNIPTYSVLMAFALTAGGAFVVSRMVGKPKAWWTVPGVAAFSGALLMTPIFFVIKPIFAGGIDKIRHGEGILQAIIKAFISIGLPEEIFKAIPVVIGVYIGRKLIGRMTAQHPARQLAVIEPLDGILIGAASGLGFAFVETLMQYVPQIILMSDNVANLLYATLVTQHVMVSNDLIEALKVQDHVDLIPAMYAALANKVGPDAAAFIVNQATRANQGLGLELLIPRLLSNVMGHSAYAGILGYFIGLAAMKPHQWIKTVLIGLCIAAGLHGIWDAVAMSSSTGKDTFWYMLLSFISFAGMATLIMKGREISPNRSQLVASQIIDRMAEGLSRSHLVPQGFGRPGGSAVVPSAPYAAPTPRSSPVPAHSITYDDGPEALLVEIGSARVPVALGSRLFERQAPGTRSSRGDSVIGEINANPNEPGVLGIKNLSEQIWHITTMEGERRELVPGRSVRLLRGMRILIGDLDALIK